MLQTLKILFFVAKIASGACQIDDWALDNPNDNGAESVGVSCVRTYHPELSRDENCDCDCGATDVYLVDPSYTWHYLAYKP